MHRRDQKDRHQRDIGDALEDAQRARVLSLEVLQVEGEAEQPRAHEETGGVAEPRLIDRPAAVRMR